MTMPWGKYKGEDIHAIPTSYLGWVIEEANNLGPALRHAILTELCARYGERQDRDEPRERVVYRDRIVYESRVPAKDRAMATEIVTAGFRACLHRYHPDKGGSHDKTIRLTEARDALLKLLG
jgi:hypothetical protein